MDERVERLLASVLREEVRLALEFLLARAAFHLDTGRSGRTECEARAVVVPPEELDLVDGIEPEVLDRIELDGERRHFAQLGSVSGLHVLRRDREGAAR